MLTPGEIWPMIASAAVIVFGAGGISVKIVNGRHVTKDFCSRQHQLSDERWKRIEDSLHEIKTWINKDGVP
jgi:hypothetical protein